MGHTPPLNRLTLKRSRVRMFLKFSLEPITPPPPLTSGHASSLFLFTDCAAATLTAPRCVSSASAPTAPPRCRCAAPGCLPTDVAHAHGNIPPVNARYQYTDHSMHCTAALSLRSHRLPAETAVERRRPGSRLRGTRLQVAWRRRPGSRLRGRGSRAGFDRFARLDTWRSRSRDESSVSIHHALRASRHFAQPLKTSRRRR